jgi:hypothetical protein
VFFVGYEDDIDRIDSVFQEVNADTGCLKIVLRPLVEFGLQFLLSYPLITIAASPLTALLSFRGMSDSLGQGVTFAGFGALTCLYTGAIVGWIVARLLPTFIATGLWIWLPPVTFLSVDILPALFQPLLLSSRLSEDIYATGDNEGLGLYFITIPTFATLGYSLGVLLRWFENRKSWA